MDLGADLPRQRKPACAGQGGSVASPHDHTRSPICYLVSSPEIIRLAVMLYVRFPASLVTFKICCTSAASDLVQKLSDIGCPVIAS